MKNKLLNSIGSYHWGLKTKGSLSSFEKMQLGIKAIAMRMKEKSPFRSSYVPINIDPGTIELPDSKLVKQALEYIDDTHQNSIKNHCLRAFVFGELFGQHEKLKYDKEIFVLSALLHDLGLEDKHCSLHKNIDCFAIEGAKEAGIYLKSLNTISNEKIGIIQDAIALHLNIKIPKSITEAYLLNKASATDTIGFYLHQISDATIQSMMKLYPRNNFNNDVHQMLKKQCKMRPESRISFLYANGFGGRLKTINFKK